MSGVLLVLTDLPQALATQQSLRLNSGDCLFALARRRRLLRVVKATEDYEAAWEAAKKRVNSGAEGNYTSVLAVFGKDRRAADILALAREE